MALVRFPKWQNPRISFPFGKTKEEKQIAVEIEIEHPGYLIAQATFTFYVGNI